MTSDLIVVADAAEARLLVRDADTRALTPMETLHARPPAPEAGEPPRRAGHVQSESRSGGATLTPRADPRRKRRTEFARTLAHRVDEALARTRLDRLVLCAPPAFLGELKALLGPEGRRHLHSTLPADILHEATPDVARRVDALLPPSVRL